MIGRKTPTIDRESYSSILTSYLPAPIRTEEENERAIAQVEALAHQDLLTKAEEDLLEMLTQLIEHFEEEHYTFPLEQRSTPLSMLLFLMEGNNLKQTDLVGVIGSKGVVSEVVNGKRGISKKMAIALGDRFNVNAGLFLA
ncbi:MAG: transcriptional regulator [Phormidesmis sp.]